MRHLQGAYHYLGEIGKPSGDFDVFLERYGQISRAAFDLGRETLVSPQMGQILLQLAVKMGIPESTIDMQDYLNAYDWRAVDGVVVFPDVFEALTMLRERGLRFGIITNSAHPMSLRDVELNDFGLLEYFPECRFAAADVGYFKPHPAMFQAALDCLGTTIHNTIVVGDGLRPDILGAQQIGMKGVQRINGDYHYNFAANDITPDATITSLLELPPIIDEWFAKK